ncbi:MAG: serine--tRNA ligase [Candidatus Parcubacteria bacterium]|nr:serine--tRNA ligase [Candidatus Parcubacteria bacterium]
MLDINFIKENLKTLAKVTKDKGLKIDYKQLLKLDDKRRNLIQEIDELRQKRNANADLLKDPEKRSAKLIAEGKSLKDKITALESDYNKVLVEYTEIMILVPNVISKDTPIGKDDKDNKEIAKWGEIPKFKFKIKDHLQLGKDLDILDIDRGVKVSGFRGYYLKNEGAQMQIALLQYAFNKMIAKGFVPFITPTLIKQEALIGSGHFPFGKEEVYQIGNPGKLDSGEEIKEPLYLAGTSEPSLLAFHANETLKEEDLPLKYCGSSTCYRSEIGSYGKDTKGLYRVHEFMKIEQVIICQADIANGLKLLEELRGIAEEVLQDLKLPYHVIAVCTGDMGAGKYKMYDLETWMPSRNAYSETHSDSFLTDWQARRLNLKYKTKDGETKYAFTLNNTVIASPRILIALWENYQNADGSITIPEILRPYLGNQEKISPKK